MNFESRHDTVAVKKGGVLKRIKSPSDLRCLNADQLRRLAHEIRRNIIDTVRRTGGHLGPNLGVVELTIALHRVFRSPEDVIVWDTGHQTYPHKLLTGRQRQFESLRQPGGLSGYPCRAESSHDWVENSHASTSLSYVFGMAEAQSLLAKRQRIVAVVGDGALTGGMSFEALNNLGVHASDCVIVLNDNKRSYAPTRSSLFHWLSPSSLDGLQPPLPVEYALDGSNTRHRAIITSVSTEGLYLESQHEFECHDDQQLHLTINTPRWPMPIEVTGVVRRTQRAANGSAGGAHVRITRMEQASGPVRAYVESLGLNYTGPIDGHDIRAMEEALAAAVVKRGPQLVHVITEKGRGYRAALDDSVKCLHDTTSIDPRSYTAAFADAIVKLGEEHENVVAMTAAMPDSTGLLSFAARFPDRFYDVGIAEQHAVTAAAGMAMAGLRPVVAIYSTFLTRAIDQIIYDVALHKLPVIFCIDRAGITGGDGPSHHGMLDLALLTKVPGMTVFAPSSFEELGAMLAAAYEIRSGPVAIRWPKTRARHVAGAEVGHGTRARRLSQGADGCVVALGNMVEVAEAAVAQLAKRNIALTLWDLRCAAPIDPEVIESVRRHPVSIVVEDGLVHGGVGSMLLDAASKSRARPPPILRLGLPVEFIQQGTCEGILASYGLDANGVAKSIEDAVLQHR